MGFFEGGGEGLALAGQGDGAVIEAVAREGDRGGLEILQADRAFDKISQLRVVKRDHFFGLQGELELVGLFVFGPLLLAARVQGRLWSGLGGFCAGKGRGSVIFLLGGSPGWRLAVERLLLLVALVLQPHDQPRGTQHKKPQKDTDQRVEEQRRETFLGLLPRLEIGRRQRCFAVRDLALFMAACRDGVENIGDRRRLGCWRRLWCRLCC